MGTEINNSHCVLLCGFAELEQFGGFLDGPQLVFHCPSEVVVMAPVLQVGHIVAACMEQV